MTYDELRLNLSTGRRVSFRGEKGKILLGELERHTSFLDEVYDHIPPRIRVFCVRESITEPPSCSMCGNPTSINTSQASFNKACSKTCTDALRKQTVAETKIGDALPFLQDASRLEDEYRTKGANEIASELGVDASTVTRFIRSHGIEVDTKAAAKLSHDAYNALTSAVTMNEMYSRTSAYDIAKKLQVDVRTVLKYLEHHNIERRDHAHAKMLDISDDALETLNDADKLQSAFKNNSADVLASQFGVSSKTIYQYLNKHGIATGERVTQEAKDFLMNKDRLEKEYNEHGAVKVASDLGVHYSTVHRYIEMHDIDLDYVTNTSFAEKELFELVRGICTDAIQQNRMVLDGKEIDIYIPSLKLGIEFNGLYWHSSKFKPNRYHLDKLELAEKKDVRLIQIFEDEWVERKEIVMNKIKHMLGVRPVVRYARKATFDMIDKKEATAFCEQHHIQGGCKSSYSFGLKEDGQIVAVMSFTRRSDETVELVRYASENVTGGFSKLLKHASVFLRAHGFSVITSFADKRWSVGNLYFTNGFTHAYDTPPDYQYVIGQTRKRKQNFRHASLEKKLSNYDPSLSEQANMTNHNIHRVYDCGLMKFELIL